MSAAHDDYKRLDVPSGQTLRHCPVCARAAELWQYSTASDGPTNKVVMCENGDQFGPQDGIADEGCLLYMPPQGFYKATMREAIRYWNDYAAALEKMQRANRWSRSNVLRSDDQHKESAA